MSLWTRVLWTTAILFAASTAYAQQPDPQAQPKPPDAGENPSEVVEPTEQAEVEPKPEDQKPPEKPKEDAETSIRLPGPLTYAEPPDYNLSTPGWRDRLKMRLGPVQLSPILLVQTQLSPYVGEESFSQAGDIAERPGFRLRRARLGFDGIIKDQVRFALSAQLGSQDEGIVQIHNAYAGYTGLPYLQIFAGAKDVPFSRSAMTGAAEGALIERPFAVRAMAPFVQVGIQAEGHFAKDAFIYYLGVYNGLQRSDQFYAGQSESYAPLGNRFEGIAFSGRVATEPLGSLGPTIEDVGHSPFRIGVGANYFFSKGGARILHGAGGDVLLHASGFHALVEVLWTQARPSSQPTQPITQVTPISSYGIVGEAGYMIVPRMLGFSARVEFIDPDPDVDNEGDNVIFTVGPSFHAFDDLLKVQLDYTHREERYGLSLANDAVTLQLQFSL